MRELRIASITATVHRVPFTPRLFDRPTGTHDLVICRVETEDGLVGWGLTGRILTEAVVAAIHNHFQPLLKGMDASAVEAIHAKAASLNPRSYSGVYMNALSAIDIALWDITGKHTGQTIAKMLGGHSDRAEAYATFGLASYDRDQLVECARAYAADGFTGLKMVVGASKGGWREDVERVRSVREAIGDDIDLLVDANFKLNPVDARALCRAIEPYGIAMFEEPLSQNDVRALAQLRQDTRIPLSAGQHDASLARAREFILHDAIDVIQPNCVYVGGYTEVRKVAAFAQAFNIHLDNGGGWPIFNMHAMAGLRNGGRVELHQSMVQVGERLFKGVPACNETMIRIPDRPGLGFEPDLDRLKETRIAAEAG